MVVAVAMAVSNAVCNAAGGLQCAIYSGSKWRHGVTVGTAGQGFWDMDVAGVGGGEGGVTAERRGSRGRGEECSGCGAGMGCK